MRIGLRAGHSRNCLGAIGLRNEWESMKTLYPYVAKILREYGHTVVDCNSDASNQSAELAEGATKANNAGVDLFISLHMNSFNGSAHGVEAWTWGAASRANAVAQRLCDNYAKLGFYNRGVKYNSNYIEEMNNIKVQLKNLDGRLKLGEEVYVYGANKDINFDIPLTVAKFFEMKDFKDIDINIGDDIFFNKVERTFKEDGSINVRFGDEITFNVNKENKSTLNFKIKGIDLEESIKTIKFILALNREKKFSMNGVRLDLDEICLDEEFIKSLERDLETLNKTKEVLEFFGIGFDIDLRKYKFDIYNEIMALYEGIIKGNDVRIKSKEKLIIFSKKIADENILLFAIKEGDTYKLFDFFKNIEKKIGFFREENGKFKLITPYVTLDTKNINCINWDNDIIMESILKHEYDNNIGDELNLLVLRIIEAFDKYSCDHLDLALNILEYLQEKDFDKDILLINKAQIFKRKGISLSDDIIGKLLYIRDNNGDEFKCCVEILLGNNPSFKFYFNKLSNEAKEVFRTWPIYTLINE